LRLPPRSPPAPQGSRQGPGGAPLLLEPQGRPNSDLLPQPLLQHHTAGGVLGRAICLAAVECPDVNRALCSALGANLDRMAVLGRAAEDAAHAAARLGTWDLSHPDQVARYTALGPTSDSHPQRPLKPSPDLLRLCQGVFELGRYTPEHGFVGVGVNLVHLTPAQLAVAVPVAAVHHGARRARGRGRGRGSARARRAPAPPRRLGVAGRVSAGFVWGEWYRAHN
jgi:hypothetical protein